MDDNNLAPLHILMVEDSSDDAQLIIFHLQQDGLKADFQRVDNETDFLTALDHNPDLILSDYSLPHFSGPRALQLAKQYNQNIPVILVSGAVSEEIIVESIKQGADDYIMKDRPARLMSAIQNALNQKRLRENEVRYRDIFENSAVAIWEEDFSEVKAELDILRANGIIDITAYISERPEFLERVVQMVKITDANKSMLKLYDATEKQSVLGSMSRFVSGANFKDEMIAFAEGKSVFEREIPWQTMQGRQLALLLTVTYYENGVGKHKAIVQMTDITDRKKAEDDLRNKNEYLAFLNDMTRAILTPNDFDSTLHNLAINMANLLDADDCYITRWDKDRQLTFPAVTTSKQKTPYSSSGEFIPSNEADLTTSVLKAGHALAADDVFNSPYINIEVAKRYPAKSALGIPLIIGNEKLGAVIIAYNTPHRFTFEEIERAEQAGSQVALALLEFQQNQEIQRRLKESNTLTEISRALSETERVGTDRILQLIVDSARDLIQQAEESVIHLLDESENMLVPRAISGFDKGVKASERYKIGLSEGVAGYVINTGETINIGDIHADPLYVHKEISPTYLSLLVTPVQSGGRPIGTISVQSNKQNAFSVRDTELLKALSIQASVAIENSNLFEATQQSLREVNALYRTSRGLASSLDTDELLKDVVNLLQKNFGYYHVQIYLLDQTGDIIVLKGGSGEIGARLLEKKHRIPRGLGIVGHVVETTTPFVTNHVNDVVFFFRNPLLPDTQSEMTVPIKVDGKVVGVIDVQERPPNRLTNNDLQLLVAVADQLSVALQKASLYANLQTALEQEQMVRSQLIQSERLALVGRLLASVSHELNNPLQAIQNALFLLKDEEKLSSQGHQDLDIILSETERMSALIERLRSAYRPGRVKDFRPVELNSLVEDVHTLISTHMRHKQVSFEFHPDPDLPPISGMSDQIRQVALNLFLNAIEVMKPGGHLLVRTQNLPQQNEILLTVKDTGPGIAPEILPNIFDAFITDKQTGTGLGLTISRDIIEQHFGRIEAENDPKGGAIFNIWLPVEKKG